MPAQTANKHGDGANRSVPVSFFPASYRSPRLLSGGHLQTIVPALLRREPPVAWRATMIGGAIPLLVAGDARRRAPMLLILHGMEGSADSPYVRALAHGARRIGWNAACLEFPTCGRRPLSGRRLYTSGNTRELRAVVERAARVLSPAPLFAVGFSLGANLLGKYLGEQGDSCPLRAAALVSAPFDLSACATTMDASLGGIYTRNFVRPMKAKALRLLDRFPGIIDRRRAESVRTIRQYDDWITAPLHGFADAEDYYARSSCGPWMDRVRVPTLLVSAANDPMIPESSWPRGAIRSNPALHPVLWRAGGHVGFPVWSGGRLCSAAEAEVLRFFRAA